MFMPNGVLSGNIPITDKSMVTVGNEKSGPCGYYMRSDMFEDGPPRKYGSKLTLVNGEIQHFCKMDIAKEECKTDNNYKIFGVRAGTSQVLFFGGMKTCPESLDCLGYRKCETEENLKYGWRDAASL